MSQHSHSSTSTSSHFWLAPDFPLSLLARAHSQQLRWSRLASGISLDASVLLALVLFWQYAVPVSHQSTRIFLYQLLPELAMHLEHGNVQMQGPTMPSACLQTFRAFQRVALPQPAAWGRAPTSALPPPKHHSWQHSLSLRAPADSVRLVKPPTQIPTG